jgi:hypothetical protein
LVAKWRMRRWGNAGSGEGRSECVGIWAAIRSDVLRKLEPLRVAEMVPWAPEEGRGGYPGPVVAWPWIQPIWCTVHLLP